MAARLDDMFSFCVDPHKVAGCVEVRFIDNVKVRTGFHHVKELRYMRGQSTAVCLNLWTLEIRDVQRILALVLSLNLTWQAGEWCTFCCSSFRVKVYLPEGVSERETQFSLSGLWSLRSSCGILCINIKVRDANEWGESSGAHLSIQVTAVMS